MVKPSFHVVAPSSKAKNRVACAGGAVWGLAFIAIAAAVAVIVMLLLVIVTNLWKEFNYSGPLGLPFSSPT
jgi:hypothetical protein